MKFQPCIDAVVRRQNPIAMFLVVLGLIASLTAWPFASAQAGDAHDWITYDNPRFGFSVDYPRDLFNEPEHSQNGDGILLPGNDGLANLITWGGHNSLELDPAGYADMASERDGLIEVTYRRVSKRWMAISGFQNGPSGREIFYERTQFNDDLTVMSSFALSYPETKRATYDHLIGRISKSLTKPRSD